MTELKGDIVLTSLKEILFSQKKKENKGISKWYSSDNQ